MHRVILTFGVVALSSAALAQEQEPEAPVIEKSEKAINVAVPHHFARGEAITRLGYLLEYWHKAFDVRAEWHGDQVIISGSIFGMKVHALFQVTDKEVLAVAADPGWPWRGRAQNYVSAKLKKYMHPTYAEP